MLRVLPGALVRLETQLEANTVVLFHKRMPPVDKPAPTVRHFVAPEGMRKAVVFGQYVKYMGTPQQPTWDFSLAHPLCTVVIPFAFVKRTRQDEDKNQASAEFPLRDLIRSIQKGSPYPLHFVLVGLDTWPLHKSQPKDYHRFVEVLVDGMLLSQRRYHMKERLPQSIRLLTADEYRDQEGKEGYGCEMWYDNHERWWAFD